MKLVKYSLLLFFLLSISIIGKSQNANLDKYTIAGTIKDSLSNPVAYAQVIIQSTPGNFIAYTQSDIKGNYRLSFSTNLDSVILMASRLGYATFKIKIPSGLKNYTIVLQNAAQSRLQEITVTDRNPIEEKGDTLSFSVRAFTNGTETVAEDVLAKLPGVNVDKNSGKIKYQGKEISKILLDGDDLSGKNYKVLSKNLSADWLSEVEILKHFSDNRLLHGIKQSEEVAINLKLKESAKAPLFGDIKLGAGNTRKYASKAELLNYFSKLKAFTVGLANNTGEDVEYYDSESYLATELRYKGFWNSEPILNNKVSAPSYFNTENFIFHEGQFVSNSLVFKPFKKLKIRSTTTLYHNNLLFDTNDSSSFYLPGSASFFVTNSLHQNQKPLKLFQNLKINYELSPSEELLVNLRYKNTTGYINTLNQTNFFNYQDYDSSYWNELFGTFSYTKKLNPNWVFITNFDYNSDRLNEKTKIIRSIFDADSIINQSTTQNNRNWGTSLSLNGKSENGFYIQSSIAWNNTKSLFGEQDVFSDTYQVNQFSAEVNLQKVFSNLKLGASNRFRYFDLMLNGNNVHKFLSEPNVVLSFNKEYFNSIDFKWRGLYNREYEFLEPYSAFSQKLVTNYRTIKSFSLQPGVPIKNDDFITTLNIADNENTFITAHIEVGYKISEQSFTNVLNYEKDIIYQKFVQNGKTNTLFSVYSIDKYFSALHTTFKFSYKTQTTNLQQKIAGIEGNNQLKQQNYNLIAGAALNKKLSLSFAYKLFQYQNKWLDNEDSMLYNNYVLKFIFNYSKQLRAVIDMQTLNFTNLYGVQTALFNSSIRYRTKNKKWEFETRFNNLFNSQSLKIEQLESSFYAATIYPLRPRFVLLSIKYKFP